MLAAPLDGDGRRKRGGGEGSGGRTPPAPESATGAASVGLPRSGSDPVCRPGASARPGAAGCPDRGCPGNSSAERDGVGARAEGTVDIAALRAGPGAGAGSGAGAGAGAQRLRAVRTMRSNSSCGRRDIVLVAIGLLVGYSCKRAAHHMRGAAHRVKEAVLVSVVLRHDDFELGAAYTAALRGCLFTLIRRNKDFPFKTHHAGESSGEFVLIKKTVFISIERPEHHSDCSGQL